MKHLLLLFSSFLISCLAISQQWIDQNYTYDSIMNLSYGSSVNFVGETETHLMDLYLPNCDDPTHTSRRPLIVFIHGGAFVAGDKNEANLQTMCKEFAKRGYVTATIDYRLGFISDDVAHTCNFPNYSCVFATDSVEWYRSCYRSIQDGKGALRFFELWTSKKLWKKLKEPTSETHQFPINSWGKENIAYRALARSGIACTSFKTLEIQSIWYNSNKQFAKDFKSIDIAGIIGNKPFLNQVVLIDYNNMKIGLKK